MGNGAAAAGAYKIQTFLVVVAAWKLKETKRTEKEESINTFRVIPGRFLYVQNALGYEDGGRGLGRNAGRRRRGRR